jgi:hypothetical protein
MKAVSSLREAREARKAKPTAQNPSRWSPPPEGPIRDLDGFCRESRRLIAAGLREELAAYIDTRLKIESARAARKALNASPTYARNFVLRQSDPVYIQATLEAFHVQDMDFGIDGVLDDLYHFRSWIEDEFAGHWPWSATLDSHFEGARLAIDNLRVESETPEEMIGHVTMIITELEMEKSGGG